MKEIQIGEYGRTNLGKIIKFAWLETSEGEKCKNKVILIKNNKVVNEFYYFSKNEYIVKHSKDITDLIEVGDIIEWEYKELSYYGINEVINRFGIIGVYGIEYDNVISLKHITIKRILTHEQFENNGYRLEK